MSILKVVVFLVPSSFFCSKVAFFLHYDFHHRCLTRILKANKPPHRNVAKKKNHPKLIDMMWCDVMFVKQKCGLLICLFLSFTSNLLILFVSSITFNSIHLPSSYIIVSEWPQLYFPSVKLSICPESIHITVMQLVGNRDIRYASKNIVKECPY